ncbi:glycosyltransferase family 2 protein [Falsirhodobacter sp. alg1]|uniref:glycosyltransferase n=1 Tax=Falsirhodobacter sp. alg1 TaxID=1472418 RepID=UPI0005EE04C4|nr:glycosyltransferase family A protein [Falsirhodobacter sp. alg1]
MTFGTIDISLTAISTRLHVLPATLRSLLAQDYGDLRINVYLSHTPYLLDQGVPGLTPELEAVQREAGERLRFVFCANTGPYRKLLPFLHEHWGLSRLVVTVDDDTIYPPHWLSTMLRAYDSHGCVIAYRGHRILIRNGMLAPYASWMRSAVEENPGTLILPTGKDGILYDTAFFPINVLNVEDAMRIAPTADDLWFRWHLASNGIQTYLIHPNYRAGTFSESDYDDSLYLTFNRGGKNDIALDTLDTYFQKRFDFSMAG